MSRSDGVYLRVMQDVIEKTHQRFVEHYGDDSKLTQMQAIWKLKMVNSGVIPAAHVTPVVRNVHPKGGCDRSKRSRQKKDNESKLKSYAELKPGKIAAYMQQPCRPWLNHRPLKDHVNDGCKEAKQKPELQLPIMDSSVMPPSRKRKQQELPSKLYKKRCILQLDDLGDTISDHSAHQHVSGISVKGNRAFRSL